MQAEVINGHSPKKTGERSKILHFAASGETPVLEVAADELPTRVIDLVTPIGMGQGA